MKTLVYTLMTVCALACAGIAKAEHNKQCKNLHGKVTAVTENMIVVDGKNYKVGDTTVILKGADKEKLSQIQPGDIVCVDTRGSSADTEGQIAAVTVLTPDEGKTFIKEKETVRETEKVKERTTDKD